MQQQTSLMRAFSIGILAAVPTVWATSPSEQVSSIESRLDSLTDYSGSTVRGKDDIPVSASGDIAVRMKNYTYYDVAPLQLSDKARTQMDAVADFALGIYPNSYVNLWTTLYFPFDFSGYFSNSLATTPNSGPYNQSERVLFDHHLDYYTASLWESMTAGIDVRGNGFGGMFKAGGVLWASSSPLTMWEREAAPRFPSQYELFEEEKTVSTYYKEKTFRPVKEGGRAFWTNRSFGGLMFDAYSIPGDFKAQFILSQPMDMDAGTRDGLRMLGGQPGEIEMSGDMDLRGAVYSGRVAKEKLFDKLTLGVNYLGAVFDRALVYEPEFLTGARSVGTDPVLIDNHVASIDFKGDIIPNLFVMLDVAMSWDDSTKFTPVDVTSVEGNTIGYEKDTYESARSDFQPGIYTKIQSKHWEPITVEAVYFPKDFYSPYAMTNPSRFLGWRKDEFYLGAGTFRYSPNLMGINLKFEPVFNRGRFDVQYGQHRQVEAGNDVVLFNYRLNGRSMWETSNSWTKYKPLFRADSGNGLLGARYQSRVGMLGSAPKFYRQNGGLWGGTWEMWESFVPYEDISQIRDSTAPVHEKWSSVISVDAGYDISHWFNTDRNIMLAAYAALSGVSTSMVPVAYSEDQSGMLLWSFFLQSEPAIAITPTLHAVGIFGLETWRGKNAWIQRSVSSSLQNNQAEYSYIGTNGTYYVFSPINYLQTAIGFGIDWDFTQRAGLHFRYKWATHSDENAPENDWKANFVQAETKVWF